MKTLEKIEEYLKQLDEKKNGKGHQKNKSGKELKFLYKTEGKDEEYDKVFRALAKKHGFDPEEIENLDKKKKKAFFDELDSKWKAKKETD
jgi:hypothetical protein